MPRTKPLNSKTNIKQLSSGDLVSNPIKYVTQRMAPATSSAGQTIVNLPFAVDLNNKDAFFLIIDGSVLAEGAGNDYTFTSVGLNNTSSQVTLSQTLPAGLPIAAVLLGALVQQEPNVNSLQSQINNLSGAGQGSVNYITAGDAEKSITGWVRYVDAAASTPVDGVGGSPAAGTTFVQSSTSPLRGTASFLFAKDAANRQGEGIAYDFTIDSADLAKSLSIDFDYSVDTNYADSDMVVYIYDKTNGVLIQPAPSPLLKGVGRFKSSFQTASNSTSYRLIFHVASTNALAYNLKLDRITVGPTVIVQGTPVTDWKNDLTFVIQGAGTTTNQSIWYRRVGDTMFIRGTFTTGTPTASLAALTLPGGYSVNPSAFSTLANNHLVGFGNTISSAAASVFVAGVGEVSYYDGSDTGNIYFTYQGSSNQYAKVGGSTAWAAGQTVNFNMAIPILGWSSNVLMSNDADTRVVAAGYTASTNGTTSPTQPVNFDTKLYDTHGAVTTGSGWKFTAPVPGIYGVKCTLSGAPAGAGGAAAVIYKNGVAYANIGLTPNFGGLYLDGSGSVQANAGDTIDVRLNASYSYGGGSVGTTSQSTVFIERMSGPAQIASSEAVNCRYNTAAGQAVGSSAAIVNFDTKDYDSHGAVTTGATWKFTAPVAGKYRVQAGTYMSTGGITYTELWKNGSVYCRLAEHPASGQAGMLNGGTTIQLNAGDYVQILVVGTAGNLLASAAMNYVSIEKVGN